MSLVPQMNAVATAIDQIGTGYAQDRRMSFIDIPNRMLIPGRDGDCSSVCGAIAYLAGYSFQYDSGFYTWTMRARLAKAGFTAIRYQNLSQLRAGDFVVREGWHVEYVPRAGRMFSADFDERGQYTGGKPGDQTGLEVKEKPAYAYGWEWILRPPASGTARPWSIQGQTPPKPKPAEPTPVGSPESFAVAGHRLRRIHRQRKAN